jgi:hypothetical protein
MEIFLNMLTTMTILFVLWGIGLTLHTVFKARSRQQKEHSPEPSQINRIHGFFFDYEMYKKGESPMEGDWPNFACFRMFIYPSASEAILALQMEEEKLREAGREMGRKLDEQVIKILIEE